MSTFAILMKVWFEIVINKVEDPTIFIWNNPGEMDRYARCAASDSMGDTNPMLTVRFDEVRFALIWEIFPPVWE